MFKNLSPFTKTALGAGLLFALFLGGGKHFVFNSIPSSHAEGGALPNVPGGQAGRTASGAPAKSVEVHPAVLNLQESFAQVAAAVKPAVVNISVMHVERYPMQQNPFDFFFWDHDDLFEQFFNQPGMPRRQRPAPEKKFYERKIPGGGSGVLIDPEGYILTNEHVVHGADEIKVSLADDPDKKLDGKVVGRDERTDLAVIKIAPHKKLPYASMGDSSALRVGDWAMAIGSPFGLAQTVTVGIISASRQNLSIQDRTYRDLIQTDAAINPGNSGGPLVNIRGEVIGINTAIYTPSGGFAGVGFAIPINQAKEIIPQLREKGKVVRGYMGISLEGKIDEATAKVFGLPDKEGALVREVVPDSPAAKAGLKRGDVIREFDGRKVKDTPELQSIVGATAPGRKVPVKLIRGKKEMTLELVTGEAPAALPGSSPAEEEKKGEKKGGRSEEWLGASFSALTPSLKSQFGIPEDASGVVVTDVKEGSKAEEIGLAEGDLVRSLNQETTKDLDAFQAASKKVKLKEGVVLDILRRGQPVYLSYMGN